MSFYTSVSFTRPRTPPPITGSDLADLLGRFFALSLAKQRGSYKVKMHFGERIDLDDKPTTWEEPLDASGICFRNKSIKWHIDEGCESIEELLTLLNRNPKTIYRAFISLGRIDQALVDYLTSREFAVPDRNLCLDSWSLSIGPAESHSLSSDTIFTVGWMNLSLSGGGYLYPWQWFELVEHLEANKKIQTVMDLCRAAWPVPPEKPDDAVISKRKKMGALWGYPKQIDRHWDWFWSLGETG